MDGLITSLCVAWALLVLPRVATRRSDCGAPAELRLRRAGAVHHARSVALRHVPVAARAGDAADARDARAGVAEAGRDAGAEGRQRRRRHPLDRRRAAGARASCSSRRCTGAATRSGCWLLGMRLRAADEPRPRGRGDGRAGDRHPAADRARAVRKLPARGVGRAAAVLRRERWSAHRARCSSSCFTCCSRR